MSMLPEAKLDILLAHHASLEAELLGQVASENYVRITRELAELNPMIDAVTPTTPRHSTALCGTPLPAGTYGGGDAGITWPFTLDAGDNTHSVWIVDASTGHTSATASKVVFTITADRAVVKAAVRPGDELRIAKDGGVEIVPTGIPGVIDSLQRAIDDLKKKFFGP